MSKFIYDSDGRIYFRNLKLFWAANKINNLIITINPSFVTEVGGVKISEFDQMINERTADTFKDFKLTTSTLLRSGAFSGKFVDLLS